MSLIDETAQLGGVATRPDPRDSMRVLPRPLQLPLTLLTGKAYSGQRPVRWTPTFHLAAAMLNMLAGLVVSSVALVASE